MSAHVFVCVCMDLYVCVCMYVFARICMYVFVRICICVYVYRSSSPASPTSASSSGMSSRGSPPARHHHPHPALPPTHPRHKLNGIGILLFILQIFFCEPKLHLKSGNLLLDKQTINSIRFFQQRPSCSVNQVDICQIIQIIYYSS